LKKEKCPDGSKDENVFDIRQGTAIALFIKTNLKNWPNTASVSRICILCNHLSLIHRWQNSREQEISGLTKS
jgi:hypothetical protein